MSGDGNKMLAGYGNGKRSILEHDGLFINNFNKHSVISSVVLIKTVYKLFNRLKTGFIAKVTLEMHTASFKNVITSLSITHKCIALEEKLSKRTNLYIANSCAPYFDLL